MKQPRQVFSVTELVYFITRWLTIFLVDFSISLFSIRLGSKVKFTGEMRRLIV